MGFFGEKTGEHEEPPSHPDELLHQLCIQPSCCGSSPVLPFLHFQNFGKVFPGFCWDSWVEGPVGGWERLDGIRERDVPLLQDAWTQGTAAI